MPLVDRLLDDQDAGLVRTAAKDDAITGYKADQIQFDDSQDSVIGIVDRIIAKNSAPQRQAETRAIQQANRRGLTDSTMATQAAQSAIYDYAVPLATTEAGNRLTVKGQNAAAVNESRGQLAGAQNQSRGITQQTKAETELLERKANIDSRLAGEQAALERELIRTRGAEEERVGTVMAGIDRQTQEALQTLRGQQAQDVTELENRYRTIQQMTETGGQYYMAMAQSIGQILAEPDITVDNKQQLVNRVIEAGRGVFNFFSTLTNIDLSDYINDAFGTPPATGAPGGAPGDAPSYWPPGVPWPPQTPF